MASVGQNWPVRTPHAVSCSLPIPQRKSTISSIDSLILTERERLLSRRCSSSSCGKQAFGFSRSCAGYLEHPFEQIGMLCLLDHVCLPKQGRCEYNDGDPFCSHASSNAPILPKRGSMRAVCLHLNEASSVFQLSRDPRTFFAVALAIDNLIVARNGCRGSITCRVLALMGLDSESASPPSQVASSLQIRRSKLHHAHEGDSPPVSPHRSSRVEVGPVWHAWTVIFLPWAVPAVDAQRHAPGPLVGQPWAALPQHLRAHPSSVSAGPDRREERTHGRPCGIR